MSDDEEMQRDEATLAEVVRLHPDRDLTDEDAPVASAPRAPGYCSHKHIALDEELHRVICRDCDREVDPFKYLMRLARDWEGYARFRKEAIRRAHEARERLEEILRLERNARARLKRIDPDAAKSAPKVPWGQNEVR